MTAPALRWREKRRTRQLTLMLALAFVILVGALLESSQVEPRRKLAEQEHWDQDDDVVINLQLEDRSSSNIKNSNDDLVEYFGTSFRVVDHTAATDELQIEILNPKPKFQYSVTIEAP